MIIPSVYYAFLPGVGPLELVVIFVVALLIFGPKKLPEMGKALGECMQQFKKASNSMTDDKDDTEISN